MDDKKLIFINLLNGNTKEQVALVFQKSTEEIDAIFQSVIHKIKCYRFARAYPHIHFDTLELARKHRIDLFNTLERIDMDKSPRYKKITTLESLNSNQIFDTLNRRGHVA